MPRPLILVVGMLATKDSEGFLKNFAGLARGIVAVPIPEQPSSLSSAALAETARSVGLPAQEADDIEAALTAIRMFDLPAPPRVLITGSLYLAGVVLALNGTLPA